MLVKGEICIFTKKSRRKIGGIQKISAGKSNAGFGGAFFVLFLYVFFVEVQEINDI